MLLGPGPALSDVPISPTEAPRTVSRSATVDPSRPADRTVREGAVWTRFDDWRRLTMSEPASSVRGNQHRVDASFCRSGRRCSARALPLSGPSMRSDSHSRTCAAPGSRRGMTLLFSAIVGVRLTVRFGPWRARATGRAPRPDIPEPGGKLRLPPRSRGTMLAVCAHQDRMPSRQTKNGLPRSTARRCISAATQIRSSAFTASVQTGRSDG
jgi:hypothetical protein